MKSAGGYPRKSGTYLYNLDELEQDTMFKKNLGVLTLKKWEVIIVYHVFGMSSIVSILLCRCLAIDSTKKRDLAKHQNLCLEDYLLQGV